MTQRPSIPRLARDERGTSMIEFAAIAPVMAFLLLGMVDYGLAFSEQIKLESAAARTIEMATGRGQAVEDYAWLRPEAAAAAGVDENKVTVTQWRECDGVKQASFAGECPVAGAQIARYVEVRIENTFTPPFDFGKIGKMFGAKAFGPTVLRGDALVRVQ